jgi:hypothetical protein
MDKRYQVFVSSTFRDLQEERRSVIQTLMDMNCIPSGMESFPAIDEEVWSYIKRAIDESDYYLLMVGGLYGSLAPDGISYTEKEFDYAIETSKRIIALLHSAPDEIPSKFTEKDQSAREKLQAFRAKVQDGRLVKYWKTADELAGKVATSLLQTMSIFPAEGWVRGNQAASIEILKELNETRKNKEELEIEVGELRQRLEGSIFTQGEEKEFQHIRNKLTRLIRIEIRNWRGQDDGYQYTSGRTAVFSGSFTSLLIKIASGPSSTISSYQIDGRIKEIIEQNFKKMGVTNAEFDMDGEKYIDEDILSELLTYGLLSANLTTFNNVPTSRLLFSEKMFRFKYWLEYSDGKSMNELKLELE